MNNHMSSDRAVLQIARRHVRMAEGHISRQHEIIATFPDGSKLRAKAEDLLGEFENTLQEHKAHLARLEKKDADG